MIKNCTGCGAEFSSSPSSNRKFCGRYCFNLHRPQRSSPKSVVYGKTQKACVTCGINFLVNNSSRNQEACSLICRPKRTITADWRKNLSIGISARFAAMSPKEKKDWGDKCQSGLTTEGALLNKAAGKRQWENLSPEEKLAKLLPMQEGYKKRLTDPEFLKTTVERIHRYAPKNRNTSIEQATAKVLQELGINYISNKYFLGYYPDFRVEDRKLIVEANGCYFHYCERCRKHKQRSPKDEILTSKRKKAFEEAGYTVLELWEHDIKVGNFSQLLEQLAA